jgi:MFS family permease
MHNTHKDNYRWYIMLLGAFTNALGVAAPGIALAVLLPEISADLKLTIVQAGFIWGIAGLPSIVMALLAGSLIDRIGPKTILILSSLLVGISSAARGLSHSFAEMMLIVFIVGIFSPFITIATFKNAAMWFEPKERGLANGVATLGMASGFFFGALVSASFLSPLLGGWRHVFFVMGGVSALFSIPWFFSRKAPAHAAIPESQTAQEPLLQGLLRLFKKKEIWLLGFAMATVSGGVQGVLGYLPLYLQGIGWSVLAASGVVALFNIASMTGVLPLSRWSDKVGARRRFLVSEGMITSFGIGAVSMLSGIGIWVAVAIAGFFRDAFMAIMFAHANQIKEGEHTPAGAAVGLLTSFLSLGNLLAPPLGNSLAGLGANVPLMGWSLLIFLGSISILLPAGFAWASKRKKLSGIEITEEAS